MISRRIMSDMTSHCQHQWPIAEAVVKLTHISPSSFDPCMEVAHHPQVPLEAVAPLWIF